MTGHRLLLAAGALDAVAALLHLACIVGGPAWYRFFGAGEAMARMAARGESFPTIITSGIAAVLAGWSAYALSGAGVLRPLPLLLPALFAIAALCLVRGIGALAVPALLPGRSTAFIVWSSLIVLTLGALHLAGAILIARRG